MSATARRSRAIRGGGPPSDDACAASARTALVERRALPPVAGQQRARGGLMIALGVGGSQLVLRARADAAGACAPGGAGTAASRAQGEMPLPALGPIELGRICGACGGGSGRRARCGRGAGAGGHADPPSEPASAPTRWRSVARMQRRRTTPAQVARDRRLSGLVFARGGSDSRARRRRARPRTPSAQSPPVQPQRTPARARRRPGGTPATGSDARLRAARLLARRAFSPAQGCLHRLHAGDRDRLDAAGHDDLHHGDRHLRCRRHAWCCSSAAPSWSARRAARCSRARRGCSCCGPRRARRPASWCRSTRRARMSSAASGLPGAG